ncbi:MAG: tRNA pseudouridine(38-40) synthase TruA [Lentimicrobium sp.]|jgi:tRNA pseudouridine38-40 synthase|nr:tRNA pseudouridine(38-40) synthase TruA [Lentimicrobium sp.]
MKTNRYFIHLAYDGSAYHGWQQQPNAITVQEVVEKALSLILSQKIKITGAGRTDTGVHARNYYAHFDCVRLFSTNELLQLVYRLNSILPRDISIYNVFLVDNDAHARFSAVSRTYHYYICRGKNPFAQLYAWQYSGALEMESMKASAAILIANRDFACFSKSGTDNATSLCSVTESYFQETDDMLIYHVKANRFLRNMVRAMVGTLLDIGKGKLDSDGLLELLNMGSRSDAGESVPAKGLFLEQVDYPSGWLPNDY